MKATSSICSCRLNTWTLLLLATKLNAATLYVDVNSTNPVTDTNAAGPGPFFYRVGVQE